ncbi:MULTISPECIES: crotonase/enoyl-CoA hydratase family protein [Methylobacterium]|nr:MULTISPECIES: crotonase/enoyl-CoA hydratase family protein [Methylobacterium]
MLSNPDWGIGRTKAYRSRPGRVETVKPEERLFALRQLEVTYDKARETLWTYMKPDGRPSYNPDMLADFRSWQDGIEAKFSGEDSNLRYLVLGSRYQGVFSFGGDLRLFAQKIRQRDRETLVGYGNACVEILHRNMNALGLPIVTIGLVQGDALGGGFESLLSFDVVVAEKGAKFGFPEILFGLFPGMGAFSFLARRIGSNKAQELILSGKTYTAEDMHAMGVVHVLAEPGKGEAAVQDYIARSSRRHNGHRAIYQAAREVDRISLLELKKIVSIWADAALKLRDQDLKIMERLVAAQDRLGVQTAAA